MQQDTKSALLYKSHRSALVDFAHSILRDRGRSEDVVQDAWVRLQNVERQRPLAEPLGYFYRIVRNLALDRHRSRRREMLRWGSDIAEIESQIADNSPDPEAQAAAREELRIVLSSLDELPERSRMALTLHTIEGFKLREVAERLGLSITFTHQLIAEAKIHCIKQLARPRS